jgi:hypothetical protein
MDGFQNLNPDNFKKWMKVHEESENDEASLVGLRAEAKCCGKKIARNIVLESGRAGRVVREFVQNGGLIKSADGGEYLIEVDSGSFYLNRKYFIV